MADTAPAAPPSSDLPMPDSPRKIKRKPSRPVEDKGQTGNGHMSSHDVLHDDPKSPPSAGAHSSPLDSEKSTGSTSANTSKPFRSHPPSSSSHPQARRQNKQSFWSKLFRCLVPCVDLQQHTVDVDDASPLREKPPRSEDRLSEKKDNAKDASTSSAGHTVEPSGTSTLPPPLTIPSHKSSGLVPPTPPADATVIIPPSPKHHRLPREETEGVTSGAVQPPGSTGIEDHDHEDRETDRSDSSSFTDDDEHDRGVMSAGAGAGLHEEDLEDEEDRLIMNGGAGIPIGPDGLPRPLLPPVAANHTGRKCLVLDLDETLVHSSFKLIPQADYVVPVEIEWQWHNVYVIKRPGVDNFLKQMGELYEIVVFTASLSKYADPVLDKLDVNKVVSHRLFRESCYNHKGNYVKDLSQLGRPIADTIILDNSPASYIFHPNNAVPVSSWFNDPHDTELTDLCPFLADLGTVDDVRGILDGGL